MNGDREKISCGGYSAGTGQISGKAHGAAICFNETGHKDTEKQ